MKELLNIKSIRISKMEISNQWDIVSDNANIKMFAQDQDVYYYIKLVSNPLTSLMTPEPKLQNYVNIVMS